MKPFLALIATAATLLATPAHTSEQKQTFTISNKPIDIAETLKVKQFDPDKGTLLWVDIQAHWRIETTDTDWEIVDTLICPGPSDVAQVFDNHETEDGFAWGLGIGINEESVGYESYIGEGYVDFEVSFTAISLSEPAFGSLKLVVTYTYEH